MLIDLFIKLITAIHRFLVSANLLQTMSYKKSKEGGRKKSKVNLPDLRNLHAEFHPRLQPGALGDDQYSQKEHSAKRYGYPRWRDRLFAIYGDTEIPGYAGDQKDIAANTRFLGGQYP